MSERIRVTWMTDSAGRESVHLNGPSMTMAQSYLGHLEPRDGSWYFVDAEGNAHGPHESYFRAKNDAMRALDAEYVG